MENCRLSAPESAPIHHNPIALRKAKIVYNFGLSECNSVKIIKMQPSCVLQYNILLCEFAKNKLFPFKSMAISVNLASFFSRNCVAFCNASVLV